MILDRRKFLQILAAAGISTAIPTYDDNINEQSYKDSELAAELQEFGEFEPLFLTINGINTSNYVKRVDVTTTLDNIKGLSTEYDTFLPGPKTSTLEIEHMLEDNKHCKKLETTILNSYGGRIPVSVEIKWFCKKWSIYSPPINFKALITAYAFCQFDGQRILTVDLQVVTDNTLLS